MWALPDFFLALQTLGILELIARGPCWVKIFLKSSSWEGKSNKSTPVCKFLEISYCMGFAQHRPCRGQEMDREGSRTRILSRKRSEEGSAAPGGFPTHHEDPRNAFPSGQRGRITVPAKHFFSETLRLPETGIAKMRPEPLYWPMLGAMFAHLGVMLGLCCHILAPCWTMLRAMLDRRVPPEVIWGYVVFMTSPSFPKFCLKRLSPVACEAPTSFLQHYFFEKAESCWGRAHPRWAPEGSHQWPARFQETLLEGWKKGRRPRAASR